MSPKWYSSMALHAFAHVPPPHCLLLPKIFEFKIYILEHVHIFYYHKDHSASNGM